MDLIAVISLIFKGLDFESNEELEQKSRFRMDTT